MVYNCHHHGGLNNNGLSNLSDLHILFPLIILKKLIKIKELNIITISNTEKINHKNYEVNVLPFYEWALS